MSRGRQPTTDLEQLRRDRRQRVDEELFADLRRQALPNAAYWLLVVGGSFAINLLLLVLVAR